MARQITQGRTHHRIKVKIYSAMFLYPKEGRFITVGSRLQEVKPSHNQGQDATTFDWRSNRQTQGGKILQQAGFDLGIQQRMNQKERQMEGHIPDQQKIV